MLEQHTHLKKLLVILAAILVAVLIFAAFSLYNMKMMEVTLPDVSGGQPEASLESDIKKQLDELGKSDDGKSSEEEIQKQLDALKEGGGTAVATEGDIRKQLDELSK